MKSSTQSSPSITGANQSKFVAEDYAVTNYRQASHLNSAHNAAEGRRENSRGKTGQCRQTLVRINGRIRNNFLRKTGTKTLEAAFSLVETKYRLVKKQQETILDRLVDEGTGLEDELVLATKKAGDKTKADFLQITLKFAAYQKEQNSSKNSNNATTLEALTLSM